MTITPASPLAYCRPTPAARLRLFCFPYAGGGASVYRTWAQDLPAWLDVCPVQYPGRETRIREQPCRRMQPMVEQLAAGLAPWLDRPFCFFGHSMGALIAFELARYLAGMQATLPQCLFVSGYRAPQLPYKSALRHDLSHEEFMRQLRELEGTPREALDSPELMEFLLPILRGDCEICDTYQYEQREPLACDISALGGTVDADVDREAMEAWRVQTRGRFSLRFFSGGHFYIQSARADVLSALSAQLQGLAAAA